MLKVSDATQQKQISDLQEENKYLKENLAASEKIGEPLNAQLSAAHQQLKIKQEQLTQANAQIEQ